MDTDRFPSAAALAPGDAMRSLGSLTALVIDEAQRLPEAARVVMGWHDSRVGVRFFQPGSA